MRFLPLAPLPTLISRETSLSLPYNLPVDKPSSSNSLMFYIPQPINLPSKGCYEDKGVNDGAFGCLIAGQPRVRQGTWQTSASICSLHTAPCINPSSRLCVYFPSHKGRARALWRAELQEEHTRLKPWKVLIKEPTGLQPKLRQISLFLPRQGSKHKRNRFLGGIPSNSIKSFLSFPHHPLNIWQGQSTAPGTEGIAAPGL